MVKRNATHQNDTKRDAAAYVRAGEACNMLGVNGATLRKLAHDRQIEAYRVSSKLRYSRKSIESFIRAGRI